MTTMVVGAGGEDVRWSHKQIAFEHVTHAICMDLLALTSPRSRLAMGRKGGRPSENFWTSQQHYIM